MSSVLIPSEWHGWRFDEEFLIDDANNKYHINDIRALFFQRQLHSTLMGNKSDIFCLKTALERKLKELDSHIVIQLVNDEECIKEIKFNL